MKIKKTFFISLWQTDDGQTYGKLSLWQTYSELMRSFVSLLRLPEGEYSYLCYKNVNVFWGDAQPNMVEISNNVQFIYYHALKFI